MTTTDTPKRFDPYAGDGSWEDESGEFMCIPGHVTADVAIGSMREHMARTDPDMTDDLGDLEVIHIHATFHDETEEWMWFHLKPFAGSEPKTMVGWSVPSRLPDSPQDSIMGSGKAERSARWSAWMWTTEKQLIKEAGDTLAHHLGSLIAKEGPVTLTDAEKLVLTGRISKWREMVSD